VLSTILAASDYSFGIFKLYIFYQHIKSSNEYLGGVFKLLGFQLLLLFFCYISDKMNLDHQVKEFQRSKRSVKE